MPFSPSVTRDADLGTVRSQLGDAARYALELRSRPADQRGENYTEDVRSAVDFINEFSVIEEALTRSARPIEQATEARGGRGQAVDTEGPELRSYGRQITDAAGFEDWRNRRSNGERSPLTIEVRNLLGGFTTGAYDSGTDHWRPVNTPALNTPSLQRRRPFLRDLIGVQQTGLASFAYLQETAASTNETGAAMTSEGSAKAEVTMAFTPADAPARKITAWIPVTDEILSDAPTLRGYIDARLDYMLMIREEAQIYNGNGTAPNLQGLKGVSGVQTQSAVAGDYPATIGQAMGKIENVDGEATAAVCNPIDYWVAVTKRYANAFDNSGNGNAPGAMAGITWGLPAVRTRAVASGAAMVADFPMAATVFERQGTTIAVGDQHSDNFIRNILVIRAEKRVALPIWRPDLIVDVTVPTT